MIAIWRIDGERSKRWSVIDQNWAGGEKGSWSACIHEENGLVDGIYELIISVDGLIRVSDAVVVGTVPSVDFSIENRSGDTICHAYMSPSVAYEFQEDRLGDGGPIPPGDRRTFAMPAGTYDLRLADCRDTVLDEAYGVDVASAPSFVLE